MIPAERFPKELAQLESEEPTLSDPLEMGSILETSAGTATESQSSYAESKRRAESSAMDENDDETYFDKNQDDDLSIASNESEVPEKSEDMELGDDEFQTDIEQKKRADNHMPPPGSLILNVKVKLEQLHYAARNGNVDFIRFLLKDKEVRDNLNPSDTKKSPLFTAVVGGNLNCVQLLIDSGANSKIFFIPDYSGRGSATNLLHLAILHGHSDLLPLLIRSGVDMEAVTYASGLTSFLFAAEMGSLACLKVLHQFKANVTAQSIFKTERTGGVRRGEEGRNALHVAVCEGHLEILPFLLQFFSVDSRVSKATWNESQGTPFLIAVERGDTEVVSFLAARGADIHAKDRFGYNAMHIAANNFHDHLIKLLHSLGVSSEERTTMGDQTALMLAAEKSCKYETADEADTPEVQEKYLLELEPTIRVILALMEIGAKTNVKDNINNTILHLAVNGVQERLDVPFFLVLKGFDYKQKNNEGLSVLDLICDHDSDDDLEDIKLKKEESDTFSDFCKKYEGLKPCFNQEHIKALSYYVERNMKGSDILLENVSKIDLRVEDAWDKLKKHFFDFHKKTIREAAKNLKLTISELRDFIAENIKFCLKAYLMLRNKITFWEPYLRAQMFGLPKNEKSPEKTLKLNDLTSTSPQLPSACIDIIMQYLIGFHDKSLTGNDNGPYSENDLNTCYHEVIFQRFRALQDHMNQAFNQTRIAGTYNHYYYSAGELMLIHAYDRCLHKYVSIKPELLQTQGERFEIQTDVTPWAPAKDCLFAMSSYSLDPKIRSEKMKKEALEAQKLKMTKKHSDSKESKESEENGESSRLAETQARMKSTDCKQAKELKAATAENAYSAGFGIATGLSAASSHPLIASGTVGDSAGSAVGSYLGNGATGAGAAPSPGAGSGSGSGVHSASGSGSTSILGKRQRPTSPTSLTSVLASSTPGLCLQNSNPMFDNFSVMQPDPKRARLKGPSDTEVSDSLPAMSSQGIAAQVTGSQLMLMSETAIRVSTAMPLTMTSSAIETASNVHNVSTTFDNGRMDTRPE